MIKGHVLLGVDDLDVQINLNRISFKRNEKGCSFDGIVSRTLWIVKVFSEKYLNIILSYNYEYFNFA